MTNEQQYYNMLTPEEWRLFKLNQRASFVNVMSRTCNLRELRHEGSPKAEVTCDFETFMINCFEWCTTPQGPSFWREISIRE